jgi:hypothetical protein
MAKYFSNHGSIERGLNNWPTLYISNWAGDKTTPDFLSKVKNKLPIPVNAHNRNFSYYTAGHCTTTTTDYLGNVSHGVAQATSYVPLKPTNLSMLQAESDRKAKDRFFDTANESKFHLGVTLAEGSKTLQMVADTATRLYESYRSLRKGDINRAISSLNITNYGNSHHLRKRLVRERARSRDVGLWSAKTWMELQYGWRPAINDVYNAVDAFQQIMQYNNDDIRIKGSATSKYNSAGSDTSTTFSNQSQVTVRYIASAKVLSNSERSMTALGLNNPELLFWELIPFSFIYDWFQPISQFLENRRALEGLSFNNGCKVVKNTAYSDRYHNGIISSNNWSTKVCDGPLFQKQVDRNYYRTVLSSFPEASIPPISLFNELNGHKVLTSLSLLRIFKG